MEQVFQPLVSIVIPVYNGSNYMREAIDSALAQTYKNVEIIVVNDGSTDGGKTEEIALSYGDKIRYIHKENGGVSTALNTGIANMKGEYFSWLSHDDKYLPEKIEKQVALLATVENKQTVALCGSRRIDKASEYSSGEEQEKFPQKQIIDSTEVLAYMFRNGSPNGCAFLLPKSVFEKCGTFDESMRFAQDFYMWLKIFIEGYPLIYERSCDSLVRVHSGQLTQRGFDIYQRDSLVIGEYAIPALKQIRCEKYNFLYEYALHSAKYNTPKVWKRCLKEGRGEISFAKRCKVRCMGAYGKVRPLIRKIYYRLFKRVKTK